MASHLDPLHSTYNVISKRIKEILTQKHHYKVKYSSRFNDKNALRKLNKIYIFFQISAVCIGVCAYMQAKFLVVEIADKLLGQALYGEHFNSPHILCIFKIDPPKSSLLENCTPPPTPPLRPWDIINDQSLTKLMKTQLACGKGYLRRVVKKKKFGRFVK